MIPYRSLYTSWKTYLEEMDKFTKNRLTQFEQLVQICDLLKQIRSRKIQISKKSMDQHLKYGSKTISSCNLSIKWSVLRKMHEEVLTSISEIDKTRKLYFDDEHLAKQARDKEEKYGFSLVFHLF